jgi:hypothetical protein
MISSGNLMSVFPLVNYTGQYFPGLTPTEIKLLAKISRMFNYMIGKLHYRHA